MAPGALLAPRKTCSVCKTRRGPARRKNHILAPFPSISYFNAYVVPNGIPLVVLFGLCEYTADLGFAGFGLAGGVFTAPSCRFAWDHWNAGAIDGDVQYRHFR